MKKILISIALLAGITLTGCNDSFLDKTPVTDLTEENAFTSYANFQSFMWPCYEMFTNTTIATSTRSNGWGVGGQYEGDVDANYFNNRSSSGFNEFAYQTVGNVASGNGWNFSSFIRRINIMLSHIDGSSMTQEEKDHWRAVGYFFHSFWYMELINRFGDVPWVDQVLTEESEATYGPRVERTIVADYVLERLRDATRNTLYSYTLTSAVNGLSPDTRIIYMEPWWIGALNTAITVSAILTAGCAAMLVLSTFVFGKKKEENR